MKPRTPPKKRRTRPTNPPIAPPETWPVDAPKLEHPGLWSADSPTLPDDGGTVEEQKVFAAGAFRLFCAKLIRNITAVNQALRRYRETGGSGETVAYKRAVKAYRAFIDEPIVSDGLEVGSPPPSRVITFVKLSVVPQVVSDYCVAVQISGGFTFQLAGPTGESSSSSSSYPVLPPKW